MLNFILLLVENLQKKSKKRFSEDLISKFLELKWWNWDIEKITKHIQDLTDNNIDKLIEETKE